MLKNGCLWVVVIVTVATAGSLGPEKAKGEVRPTAATQPGKPSSVPAAPNTPTTQPVARPHVQGRRRFRPLDPQQEMEVLNFLKRVHPEHYERLRAVSLSQPQRYHWTIRRIRSRYLQWPREMLSSDLDKRYQRARIVHILRQIRATNDPEEIKRLKRQFRGAVTQHWMAEQEFRFFKLRELEKEVEQTRTELKENRARGPEIVTERIERWLGGPRLARPTTRPREQATPKAKQK